MTSDQSLATDAALLDLRLLHDEVVRTVSHWEDVNPLPTLSAIVLHRHMATVRAMLAEVSDVLGSNGGGHLDDCDCLSCQP